MLLILLVHRAAGGEHTGHGAPTGLQEGAVRGKCSFPGLGSGQGLITCPISNV